jgi:hypothetical protein
MKKALLFSGLLLAVNVLFAQTWTTSGSNTYLSPTTAYAGIGTSSPSYPLDVHGYAHTNLTFLADCPASTAGFWARGASSGNGNMVFQGGAGTWQAFWISGANGYLEIGGNGGVQPTTGVINVDYTGHVGINTLNTSGFTFNVNGTAVFDQVTVEVFSGNNPNATPWADYVFDKGYQLPSIYSLADYIKANSHLPGIPTTAEVKKDGLDVGATEAKLLEKIEQLTLYTIDLQKQIDSLKSKPCNSQ